MNEFNLMNEFNVCEKFNRHFHALNCMVRILVLIKIMSKIMYLPDDVVARLAAILGSKNGVSTQGMEFVV